MQDKTKFDLLHEDLTMVSNQYTAGTTRAHKPVKVSILDIIKSWKDANNTDPEGLSTAKPTLYPLNDAFVERLADEFLRCNDFQNELSTLYRNPAIQDNDRYKKSVKVLFKKFKKIKNIILSMGNDMDNLAIEDD
tara:strand:+ start:261 stop:665 length:405 start_codon:yes stop_codon:yes gene_type:complete